MWFKEFSISVHFQLLIHLMTSLRSVTVWRNSALPDTAVPSHLPGAPNRTDELVENSRAVWKDQPSPLGQTEALNARQTFSPNMVRAISELTAAPECFPLKTQQMKGRRTGAVPTWKGRDKELHREKKFKLHRQAGLLIWKKKKAKSLFRCRLFLTCSMYLSHTRAHKCADIP